MAEERSPWEPTPLIPLKKLPAIEPMKQRAELKGREETAPQPPTSSSRAWRVVNCSQLAPE